MNSLYIPSENKRLCLVTETWLPEINGVAMTLSRLVHGLIDTGWAVTVLRPSQKQENSQPHHPALKQITLPGLPIPGYAGLRFGLPVTQRLYQAWQADRPDVVHIATEGPLGWAAMKVAERLEIPVTTTFHTNFHRYCKHYRIGWLRGAVTRYLRLLHNRSACTMVPNEMLKQMLLEEGYQNVEVLGRGVDNILFSSSKRSQSLRQQWGVADNGLAVIYVGRMAAEKNLDLVVKAFEAIWQQNPNAKMIWVGDGPQYARLRRQYPQHIFAGAQMGEALAQHYASADMFLFPSMTETYGNVVTEAMASGLAVVAYDYAAAALHIKHLENGLLVPFGDAESFIKNARFLATRQLTVSQLGANAQTSLSGLNWKDVCEIFEKNLHAAIQASNCSIAQATDYASATS